MGVEELKLVLYGRSMCFVEKMKTPKKIEQ